MLLALLAALAGTAPVRSSPFSCMTRTPQLILTKRFFGRTTARINGLAQEPTVAPIVGKKEDPLYVSLLVCMSLSLTVSLSLSLSPSLSFSCIQTLIADMHILSFLTGLYIDPDIRGKRVLRRHNGDIALSKPDAREVEAVDSGRGAIER